MTTKVQTVPSRLSPSPEYKSKSSRNGPRSRNGCWTCRTKKVKCDEVRPKCCRCLRLKLLCDYSPRMKQSTANRILGDNSKAVTRLSQNPPCALKLPIPTSELANSASSIDLTSADHEAIRYYRTTFARLHHTKNPDYGLYAVIFSIAEREPIVMRVVLALGGQELEFRKRRSEEELAGTCTVTPLHHYAAALRMLAEAVDGSPGPDGRQLDLDAILAAIFLMLWYEQKFGDASCRGFANHLAGTARVVEHRCRNDVFKRALQEPMRQEKTLALVRMGGDARDRESILSQFSARMLSHLCIYDSMAAGYGLGGRLVETLSQALAFSNSTSLYADKVDSLHGFSYGLYRVVWAQDYPQEEMLDDLENRTIYCLASSVVQLRFMISRLESLGVGAAGACLAEIEAVYEATHDKFEEIFGIADALSPSFDSANRLVANIRQIVPQYYGTKIQLARAVRKLGLPSKLPTEDFVGLVMSLCTQALRHNGNDAMLSVANALFMAAIETSDASRRDWFTARFQALCAYGCNYARAHRLLVRASAARSRSGMAGPLGEEEVSAAMYSENGDVERFVI
ncbi:Zn(2)-Cys(6) zinc finger domain protein [Metarhizium robertsii]|uniref:C6 zinc finger domain protein n=2 Tax=Metarhizium robertsii TaxID=568076 RepID=E9F862_METRA|nr:C6 zinc finger domain protein [Metarhizium robertsii ARSEF 23]EFY96154.1 C6 zinc finger domain protein [Metarhizium robertsii ARSEF 23]EXU98315.1 Zn(2)-Cys(6) zinc finger domain protein [Metarhizium robertsii]